MHIEILSLDATPISPLMPAPNVTEYEYISEYLRADTRPVIKDLATAGLIEILANYRGYLLYCNGGVMVYRNNPKTPGGHGRVGMPEPGIEEDVFIVAKSGNFYAKVVYLD